MKKILTLAILTLSLSTFGQVVPNKDILFTGRASIGKGNGTATHNSALLELGLEGTVRGLLLPRVNDIDNISSPARGLLAYSLEDHTLNLRSNTVWVQLLTSLTGMKYTDTTSMLLPYIQINEANALLLPYLLKADTTTMLAPYIQINEVNALLTTYLLKGDTATMLSPYMRKNTKFIDSIAVNVDTLKVYKQGTKLQDILLPVGGGGGGIGGVGATDRVAIFNGTTTLTTDGDYRYLSPENKLLLGSGSTTANVWFEHDATTQGGGQWNNLRFNSQFLEDIQPGIDDYVNRIGYNINSVGARIDNTKPSFVIQMESAYEVSQHGTVNELIFGNTNANGNTIRLLYNIRSHLQRKSLTDWTSSATSWYDDSTGNLQAAISNNGFQISKGQSTGDGRLDFNQPAGDGTGVVIRKRNAANDNWLNSISYDASNHMYIGQNSPMVRSAAKLLLETGTLTFKTYTGSTAMHFTGDDVGTFLGLNAGNTSITGLYNTGIGYAALQNITNPTGNTAVGGNAAVPLLTGTHNTIIGFDAFNATGVFETGSRNIVIGAEALTSSSTDYSNTLWVHSYSGAQPILWGNISNAGASKLAVNSAAAPVVTLEAKGTDAILIPIGNTAARPTGVEGYMRYNSQTDQFEGYKDGSWQDFVMGPLTEISNPGGSAGQNLIREVSANYIQVRQIAVTGGGTITQTNDSLVTINITGGSSGYTTVQEEGSSLTQRSTIDFVGAGFTASDNGSKTLVTLLEASASQAGVVNTGAQTFLTSTSKTITRTANGVTDPLLILEEQGNSGLAQLQLKTATQRFNLISGATGSIFPNQFAIQNNTTSTTVFLIDGANFIHTGSSSIQIKAQGSDNVGESGFMAVGSGGTSGGFLKANITDGDVKIGGTGGGYFPAFYANNTERARITTVGDFLIGTTTNTFTDRLVVSGNTYLLGALAVRAGDGVSDRRVRVGGTLAYLTADIGTSGTSETDLFSYSVTANTLNASGEYLEFEVGGTHVTGGGQTYRVKFGSTTLYTASGMTFENTGFWTIKGRIFRTGTNTARVIIWSILDGSTGPGNGATTFPNVIYADISSTDLTSGTHALKVTGQAGATNDIVAKAGTVGWYPVAVTSLNP